MPMSSRVAGWSDNCNSSRHREHYRLKSMGGGLKSRQSRDNINRPKSAKYLLPFHDPDYVSPYSLPLPRIPPPELIHKKKRIRRKRKTFVAEDDFPHGSASSAPRTDEDNTERKAERTPRPKSHKRSATAPAKHDEREDLDGNKVTNPQNNKIQKEDNKQQQDEDNNNANNDKQLPFCNRIHPIEIEQRKEKDSDTELEQNDQQEKVDDEGNKDSIIKNNENQNSKYDSDDMDKQNQQKTQKKTTNEEADNKDDPAVAKNDQGYKSEKENKSGGKNDEKQMEPGVNNQPTKNRERELDQIEPTDSRSEEKMNGNDYLDQDVSTVQNKKSENKNTSNDEGVTNNKRERRTNSEKEKRKSDMAQPKHGTGVYLDEPLIEGYSGEPNEKPSTDKRIKEQSSRKDEKQNGTTHNFKQTSDSSNLLDKQEKKKAKKKPNKRNWKKVKHVAIATSKSKDSKGTKSNTSQNPYKVGTFMPKHGSSVRLEESLTKDDSDDHIGEENKHDRSETERTKESSGKAEPLKVQENHNHTAINIKDDDSGKMKVIVSTQYITTSCSV